MSDFTMPIHFTADEYATLGSELEASQDSAALNRFYREHLQNGDIILATLAQYAFWHRSAVRNRLHGAITVAELHEQNAEYEYNKLPADCRW